MALLGSSLFDPFASDPFLGMNTECMPGSRALPSPRRARLAALRG
jgi:hypothetical protein